MQMEYKVTLGENGRLLIPAKIRERLGISQGDQVMLIVDDVLKIVPLKDMVRKYQAFVKERNVNNVSLVNSLKETRLEESKNE